MFCSGLTDKGMKRKSNQDCFRVFCGKKFCAAVVCDGMGGAKGGSTASRIAATVFMKTLKQSFGERDMSLVTSGDIERILVNAISAANDAVYEKAGTSDAYEGMGTTLVAFVQAEGKTVAVNTGDSRLYMTRGGKTEQVSKDHSFVQYLVDTGKITPDEAINHPQKNIILKVVGVSEHVECDIYNLPEYDSLLLCSDGLTNMLGDDEINEVLNDNIDTETKTHILVDLANEKGGADNITAVIYSHR